MKALSIKQPWSFLIIHCGKDIENRTWSTKFRGRFLIHASKSVDKAAMKKYAHLISNRDLRLGGIVGSVELVDVVRQSESGWFQGPVGFVLKDPRPEMFKEVKGKLNFFEVEF